MRAQARALLISCAIAPVFGLIPIGAVSSGADPIIASQGVSFDPSEPTVVAIGELTFLSGVELSSLAPGWGGFSDMALSAQAGTIVAVTDLGWLWRFAIHHDSTGRIDEVRGSGLFELIDENGTSLADDKERGDAEAIAPIGDREFLLDDLYLIAFERQHRLARLARYERDELYFANIHPIGPEAPLPSPFAEAGLEANSGVESLVFLPDGTLLALAEGAEFAQDDIPGWLRNGEVWEPFSLARTEDFRPTALTLLPSGDLLMVERRYRPETGAGVRLSVIAAATLQPGARLEGREIARWGLPLTIDNFESVGAIADKDGGTVIYLLSDDNRNPEQRTLLLQFYWPGR